MVTVKRGVGLAAATVLWSTTGVVLAFNVLISGFIHDRLYEASLSPQEYAEATGNGVVPGYWLTMPFIMVFLVVPVWLILSFLVILVARVASPGEILWTGPVTAGLFLALLLAVSGAAHVYFYVTR